MHNRVQDRSIEAVDLFVDLAPLDANRLRVCDQLVREFVDRDDVRLRRLRDVVGQPLLEKIDSARAHVAISSPARLSSALLNLDNLSGWLLPGCSTTLGRSRVVDGLFRQKALCSQPLRLGNSGCSLGLDRQLRLAICTLDSFPIDPSLGQRKPP
ncbi:mll8047 [Mesorhizobium japonicum MAFF 303099]|uniref:Mll8047 protein n=1 Tax=Mesorhizobium japonicum (strain LMG 29417 / CECT 9101 / MAFF 303099) TaxID=266835 RepID=Q984D8_RHILO|nr:mll8047 [Mesorhizobium japonicum MAFF 303099]